MSFPKAVFLANASNPDQYPRHRRAEVALAGRSNVGKSSFINAIANRRNLAHTSKRPGRTRAINFIALDDALCIVDLPGYGYADVPASVQAAWQEMIEVYFAQREQLKAVFVLIDGRHGPTLDDRTMLEWLSGRSVDYDVIATKWDKVPKGERLRRLAAIEQEVGRGVVPFSAHSGEGRDAVIKRLLKLR